jgi:hypothetical protein
MFDRMSPILVDKTKIDHTSKYVIGHIFIGYNLDVAKLVWTSQSQFSNCFRLFSLF